MNNFMNYDFNVAKILLACYVGKGMGMRKHTDRQGHGLAFHLSGIKVYEFDDGRKITVGANELIYLPKHSTYEVTSRELGDCYAINFDISEEISLAPFAVKIKNQAFVLDHFKTSKKAWEQKLNGYNLKCKADMYNIIYTMQKEYFTEYLSKRKLEIIKPAVEYIHSEYTHRLLSVDELSDMCGITPEYFRKIFKINYGISPIQYINNLKISHAKELLRSGMYSVSEAAFQSGYADLSHFSREFKKAVGTSPKTFLSS